MGVKAQQRFVTVKEKQTRYSIFPFCCQVFGVVKTFTHDYDSKSSYFMNQQDVPLNAALTRPKRTSVSKPLT